MKLVGLTLAAMWAGLSVATPAFAEDVLANAQMEAFSAFDANQDGAATAAEMVTGLFALFAAADSDQSNGVSLDEFKTISLGYAYVAEKNGKVAAYEETRVGIFKRWDLNSDSMLSQPELVGGTMLETLESAKFSISKEDFFKTKFVEEMTNSLK